MSEITYSVAGQKVLELAKQSANEYGNRFIGTEHLLLGLINFNNPVSRIIEEFTNLDGIRDEIHDALSSENNSSNLMEDPDYTPRMTKILNMSHEVAQRVSSKSIQPHHLFLAMICVDGGVANQTLQIRGVDLKRIRQTISQNINVDEVKDDVAKSSFLERDQSILKLKNVQKYGEDITIHAFRNELDPVIGREKELERVIEILGKRRKNNPVLVGESGVGKTAIVEALALRIVNGSVPEQLLNKHVISIDLAAVVAGTKYRGQFEERIKGIIAEVEKTDNIILFIDEIHQLIGAGAGDSAMDASNIMKPMLARGKVQVLGATTIDEYRQYIESDKALQRRFRKVKVNQPTSQECYEILKGVQARYEDFHRVTFTDSALKSCVELSNRYIKDESLPDKAINLMDEAGARAKFRAKRPTEINKLKEAVQSIRNEKNRLVADQMFEEAALERNKEMELQAQLDALADNWREEKSKRIDLDTIDIRETVAYMTGIPLESATSSLGDKINVLQTKLGQLFVGQEKARTNVLRTLRRADFNLHEEQGPLASYMFLGPTGVGKTYLAKLIAEHIFGPDSFKRIDMSEYSAPNDVTKLYGAPPGYVGYGKGGELTEQVRHNPFSLILLDEIEKAHPDVHQSLLQVLDDGAATDSTGRKVDFTNTIIIMTSNVGSQAITKEQRSIGFTSTSEDTTQVAVMGALKQVFRPEFLNRINCQVVFDKLSDKQSIEILNIELEKYVKRLEKQQGLKLNVTKKALDVLSDKVFSTEFGARQVKRDLQRLLEDPIIDLLVSDRDSGHKKISVKVKKDELDFAIS